ncbi:hypothetical protein BBP40_005238 [Aspergillus hancockii]|nr:hypothetical protein BBP40_005238 [Aspergillus hancockii]
MFYGDGLNFHHWGNFFPYSANGQADTQPRTSREIHAIVAASDLEIEQTDAKWYSCIAILITRFIEDPHHMADGTSNVCKLRKARSKTSTSHLVPDPQRIIYATSASSQSTPILEFSYGAACTSQYSLMAS